MTWTWTEVIALALVRSGWVGLGQVATASQGAFGMKVLNLLLDKWDGEGLALPNFTTSITFNTVADRAEYLLGAGTPNDFAVRPETIISGTVTIATGPAVNMSMVEMPYAQYFAIPVPAITAQPWNYAINQTWPQMKLYLYPTPDTVYPVTLNCKVKWIDTVGAPDLNPFEVAEVPSGYAQALVANLAYEIAKWWRLDTAPSLEYDASQARFMITSAVLDQHRKVTSQVPVGLFGIDILTSGRNP